MKTFSSSLVAFGLLSLGACDPGSLNNGSPDLTIHYDASFPDGGVPDVGPLGDPCMPDEDGLIDAECPALVLNSFRSRSEARRGHSPRSARGHRPSTPPECHPGEPCPPPDICEPDRFGRVTTRCWESRNAGTDAQSPAAGSNTARRPRPFGCTDNKPCPEPDDCDPDWLGRISADCLNVVGYADWQSPAPRPSRRPSAERDCPAGRDCDPIDPCEPDRYGRIP